MIAVAGCVAQAEGEEIIRRAPAVDLVFGPQNYHRLPELLARAARDGKVVDTEFPADDKFDHLAAAGRSGDPRPRRLRFRHGAGRLRQVLHVLRGALYARRRDLAAGRKRSSPKSSGWPTAGVREITLIGQNVNAYHGEGAEAASWPLARLLRAARRGLHGVARLRYTTSHPRDMDDDLIAAHRDLRAADAATASAGAVGLRPHSRGDEPPPHARRLSRCRRRLRDGAARYGVDIGFHRRLSRRDRSRFRRQRCDLVDEIGFVRRVFVQIFAAARNPGRRRWTIRSPRTSRSNVCRGCRTRSTATGGLQSPLRRPHLRRAVRKPGRHAGPDRRPFALSAAGAGHGAGVADRRNRRWSPSPKSRTTVCSARWSQPSANAGRGPRRMRRSLNCDTPEPVDGWTVLIAPASPTQIVLAFDDNRLASALFGQYGQNLALIERRLGVVANSRGNQVTSKARAKPASRRAACSKASTSGSSAATNWCRATSRARSGCPLAGLAVRFRSAAARENFEEINLRKRRGARPHRRRRTPISARSSATRWCSSTGPAGTGKTWLAVAHAVQLFERKEVDRIVLSRPAVEAGERLGFLPGDMREKVDPYLRPIYDALYDLMDARIVERALQTAEIEIAPLAFMRGRTLANAVVILDEAQNTTAMQMKMFLTRLGENSRMMVTGDPSQVDLPPGQTSGLAEAVRLLARRRRHRPCQHSRPQTSSAMNSSPASSPPTTAPRRKSASGANGAAGARPLTTANNRRSEDRPKRRRRGKNGCPRHASKTGSKRALGRRPVNCPRQRRQRRKSTFCAASGNARRSNRDAPRHRRAARVRSIAEGRACRRAHR